MPEEAKSGIAQMTSASRDVIDTTLAAEQKAIYARAQIINRSWGHLLSTRVISAGEVEEEREWYEEHLPKLLDAYLQKDTGPDKRTIVVYAAGNSGNRGQDRPAGEAQLPYHIEELRGHTLAVVATDPETRRIADYSNLCGPLPPGWNNTAHGPHYCLAAPGTMQVRVPDPTVPGQGTAEEWQGTSFAAPLVSGAIALMMEHFGGTMGNTAVVRRMLDTANRDGIYADGLTYGAGEGTAGIGREPASGHWGYGFAASSDGAFAARGEGAFDAGTHAGLIWANAAADAAIGTGIGVKATATLAMSAARCSRPPRC